MAGIGFKLQKMLVEDMYLSSFKGFFFALVITSGPWIIMVLSLSVLSLFSSFLLNDENKLLFNTLFVHACVIALIITGTFQLFFTRVFADNMYSENRKGLSNIIMSNLLLIFIVLTIILLPFLFNHSTFPTHASFGVKLLTFLLTLTTATIWVLLNYVSASDEFLDFIKHYVAGCVSSIVLSGLLAYSLGFNGFFLGFFVGQAYIAMYLLFQTFKVFGFPDKLDLLIVLQHPQYRVLFLSGFLLYAGMWIDKFISWYGTFGQSFTSILYYNTSYNSIFFVAFLFTTPIMALFLINMETSFYKKYYLYNRKLLYSSTLDKLRECCKDIKKTVKDSLINIIRIQGLIIILGILFSKEILIFFKQPESLQLLFSIVLVGVFFHMLTLIICILMFYFDLKYETMIIYLAFFILNGISTFVFMKRGEQYTGMGFLISSFIVFGYSLWRLFYNLNFLNFLSLTRHKMDESEDIDDIYIPSTSCYGRYYVKNGESLLDNT
ncbi:MAG: exopolysaccharide Pel transporter PelG [Candidatus Brocadiaceae bacterium]|nr:exopolysaccharide Pel transporter PelG [Candidatus Brocadiaceae bacterium]